MTSFLGTLGFMVTACGIVLIGFAVVGLWIEIDFWQERNPSE